MSPAYLNYSLREASNIANSELNAVLELADVPSEERVCESLANERSEKEKKSGRGESSHWMTFFVKTDRDQ